MSEFMWEDSPQRLRRKDIRKDKFRLERDKPYAEFKRVQKGLRSRIPKRIYDTETVPGSEE